MKRIIKLIIHKIVILANTFYKTDQLGLIYYHDVTTGKGESFNKINIEKFEDQMRYIADNNYTSLIFSGLGMEKITKEKTVLITFDDGYISNYELVFPIMKKYNLKFNIFLEAGAIDNKDNYLTWDMVKEMVDSGLVGFGAHTYNHIDSRFINEDTYDQEVKLANELITKYTGKPVEDYCFPFGAYNKYIINYLNEKKSYKRLYTSDGTKNTAKNGVWLLGRVGIDNDDDLKVFVKKLQGEYDLYYKTIRTLNIFNTILRPEYTR